MNTKHYLTRAAVAAVLICAAPAYSQVLGGNATGATRRHPRWRPQRHRRLRPRDGRRPLGGAFDTDTVGRVGRGAEGVGSRIKHGADGAVGRTRDVADSAKSKAADAKGKAPDAADGAKGTLVDVAGGAQGKVAGVAESAKTNAVDGAATGLAPRTPPPLRLPPMRRVPLLAQQARRAIRRSRAHSTSMAR